MQDDLAHINHGNNFNQQNNNLRLIEGIVVDVDKETGTFKVLEAPEKEPKKEIKINADFEIKKLYEF